MIFLSLGRIACEMGRHYRGNKNVVIWQADNEIGHEGSDMCWCDNCLKEFQKYLRDKYQNIDELNERWGTVFWSQKYDSFEDVVLPKDAYTAQNPSLRLEWERFRSLSAERYIRLLYDQLKAADPEAVVLHDFEGGNLEKHFDPYAVARPLDDVAYNNYPVWGGSTEPMTPWAVALSLDAARGLKGANFWVTEEIMGAQGHDTIGCAVKPKQGSVWAMQALAHGVKNFLIFRYRGFTKGAEQYCYGIIDADNQKRRKFREVKELYHAIREHEQIFQSPVKGQCAMVFDYDSAASFRIQRQSDAFHYVREMERLYKQLYSRSLLTDVITKADSLDGYELVILPHMIVMSDEFKEKLKDYVRKGGTVVMTARTAWKDTDNNLVFGRMLPVDLTDLAGVEVCEQESLLNGQSRAITDGEGSYQLTVFADMLKPAGAQSIMKYENNPFGDHTAVSMNRYGQGRCFYLGGSLDDRAMEKVFTIITGKKSRDDLNRETVIRDDHQILLDYENMSYEIKQKG